MISLRAAASCAFALHLILMCSCWASPPPVAPAPSTAAAEAEAPSVVRRLGLMGTMATVEVDAPSRAEALAASEAVVRALEATEARLSTWREGSELAELNRAPVDRAVRLTPVLWRELTDARRYTDLTAGAFDPTIGALVDAWGLRSGGRIPTAEERLDALAASGFTYLRLDNGFALRRSRGLRVEEGGFGKGAGIDAAIDALRASRARWASVDLGGQLGFWTRERTASHATSIADPRDRNRPAVALRVGSGSLATSGNSEHALVADGRRFGHILDPATGLPAPDFGSVTVWAASGLAADCLSTGLYVMGPEGALRWSDAHPEYGVLVIETTASGLRARAGGTLRNSGLQALVDDINIETGDRSPAVQGSATSRRD